MNHQEKHLCEISGTLVAAVLLAAHDAQATKEGMGPDHKHARLMVLTRLDDV